eukprot:Plantae.Rhodophyta-Purpureofilum_apyrenoidigerum.ctg28001.p1 GENE.Plantae.Rhodophyta-Purpureofilum_apyrenoidigerum.ctg28001~~Plantae.Rhodophyta-Purpureofilum_apyrenoidigerum.ctg28001.p1  ORF type:complete len:161 (+),score=9.90 Plantae.Rhodophyta-Purpureofilum_apyrenoidigerum.ctg28001:75-557(+)
MGRRKLNVIHECEFCKKRFPRSYNLNVHRRIHTGDQPYACEEPSCSRSFAWKSSLDSHRLSHQRKALFSSGRTDLPRAILFNSVDGETTCSEKSLRLTNTVSVVSSIGEEDLGIPDLFSLSSGRWLSRVEVLSDDAWNVFNVPISGQETGVCIEMCPYFF